MANVTITLTEPIEGPAGRIDQIVLRAPKFPDVMQLGEPVAFARSEGNMIFQAEKDEVVEGYIKRLLVEPKDPQLLMQLGLTDTIKLKEAIFEFFRAARPAISS